MCISVFFSYSALLNAIFKPQARAREQLREARVEFAEIFTTLSDNLRNEQQHRRDEILKGLDSWYQELSHNVDQATETARHDLDSAEGHLKMLKKKADQERLLGGTTFRQNGRQGITGDGRGPFARLYERQALEYEFKEVEPLKSRLEPVTKPVLDMGQVLQDLSGSAENLTPAALGRIESDFLSTQRELARFSPATLPSPPPTMRNSVDEFDEARKSLSKADFNKTYSRRTP